MRKVSPSAFALTLLLVVAGIAFACYGIQETWDGGFPQVEFQVTVIDRGGVPLEGVTLSVTSHNGETTFGYPVTDFTESLTPTSDERGLLVFHHVNLSPEYGGKCRKLFFLIPVGTCEAPRYTLHFLLRDKEVARFEYDEYLGRKPSDWSLLPKKKRRWEYVGRSSASLPEHLRPENHFMPNTLDYYVLSKIIIISQ